MQQKQEQESRKNSSNAFRILSSEYDYFKRAWSNKFLPASSAVATRKRTPGTAKGSKMYYESGEGTHDKKYLSPFLPVCRLSYPLGYLGRRAALVGERRSKMECNDARLDVLVATLNGRLLRCKFPMPGRGFCNGRAEDGDGETRGGMGCLLGLGGIVCWSRLVVGILGGRRSEYLIRNSFHVLYGTVLIAASRS